MAGPEERFWSRVAKSDGCWLWTGLRNRKGYGYIYVNGSNRLAHRYSWLLAHGVDPGAMLVCHRCDTPQCVRPDHLFLGTAADNLRDCIDKGRAKYVRGERNGRAKFSTESVLEIRRRRSAGETLIAISQALGISESTVWNIAVGNTWRHVR